MAYEVRLGRPDDHAAIAAFTTDTFEWGDYVADAFPGWLDDPSIEVLVAHHDADGPVAVATLRRPGPRQAWLAAARVRPDHRRKGLANMLNEAAVELARGRGDRVARLAIEDWNEAPQRQVEGLGYRLTGTWRTVVEPVEGHGRLPTAERLDRTSGSAESWAVWQRSSLGVAARGLIGLHWTWWTATPEDLARFAGAGHLWACPSGWVVAEPTASRLTVNWLAAADRDLPRLVRACRDLAGDLSLAEVAFVVPEHGPTLGLLDGDDHAVGIWELPLG